MATDWKNWTGSLQAKLIAVLVVAVLGAAVTLTVRGTSAASAARTDAAHQQLSREAATAAFEVERAVDGLPGVLRALRETPPVQGYLRTTHAEDGIDPVDGNSTSLMWQGRLATIMAGYLRANPSFRWLQFAMADGELAAEATSDGDTVSVSPIVDLGPVVVPDLLADAVALDPSEAVSAPITTGETGERLFWVAIPVEAADSGEVEAAMLIAVTVEPLLSSIGRDHTTGGAGTALAASDGRLLAAPDGTEARDLAGLFGGEVAELIEASESDVIVDGDLQIAWVTAKPVPGQPSSFVSIVRSVDAEVVTASARQFRNTSVLIALAVLVLSVLPAVWLIRRTVVQPLQAITDRARAMANGDLSTTLEPLGRRDEIGDLNEAFRTMADAQRSLVSKLEGSSRDLEDASGRISALAAAMTGNDGAGGTGAAETGATTTASSMSIGSVASSLEEMRDSIQAVAANASEASTIASDSVAAMELTAGTVRKLGESSLEISDVLNLINDIAAQVNLLSLNATIEAARAGEAGKGFAVVAGEVKELAARTSAATDQIVERIDRIRHDTDSAVEATEEVRRTIGRVDEISSTIASSVEQQSTTTHEITGAVAQVSEVAGELTGSAQQLSAMSSGIRGLLERYRVDGSGRPGSPAVDDRIPATTTAGGHR